MSSALWLSRPNNSQSRKSTPSFTDSCYVWSTNNLPFPPAHMCIHTCTHTTHTPAASPSHLQSATCICHPRDTILSVPSSPMSERTQNLPSTRIQGNPTLAAENEGMGRGCPPLALEDPLKHKSQTTQKSPPQKTLDFVFIFLCEFS